MAGKWVQTRNLPSEKKDSGLSHPHGCVSLCVKFIERNKNLTFHRSLDAIGLGKEGVGSHSMSTSSSESWSPLANGLASSSSIEEEDDISISLNRLVGWLCWLWCVGLLAPEVEEEVERVVRDRPLDNRLRPFGGRLLFLVLRSNLLCSWELAWRHSSNSWYWERMTCSSSRFFFSRRRILSDDSSRDMVRVVLSSCKRFNRFSKSPFLFPRMVICWNGGMVECGNGKRKDFSQQKIQHTMGKQTFHTTQESLCWFAEIKEDEMVLN